MIFLIILLVGFMVAWLAAPIARRFNYDYGRFGRTGDMALVVAGALLGGVLLTALLGAVGQTALGDTGMLILGFIGALVMVVLLVLFGASSAAAEPNNARDLEPSNQIDDTGTTQTDSRP